ncbi:MAG: hypothetical protein KAR42_10400 [candidate division Zixibacteria bacterium]|nr:hypothetical protein [candidate division Zixibacteria bacterium]
MANISRQKIMAGNLSAKYAKELKKMTASGFITDVLEQNSGLFGKRGKAFEEQIVSRLGWTDVVRLMQPQVERMGRLVEQVKESGAEHLFVLGMGGSSLCPEVFGKVFGKQSWLKSFNIVDTTAPSQMESIMRTLDPLKGFYIVASKSGTTIETLSQFRYFFRMLKDLRPLKAGNFFAAITDEYSELYRMARRNRFCEVFNNPEDIGGRYSALSFFGLVPGAFTKMNLTGLLKTAEEFLDKMEDAPEKNDALELGTLMGVSANAGRDKLRFAASKKTAPFIPWIEQLVAESTGKRGKGIIPIEGEEKGVQADFSNDGLFVYYSMGDKPSKAPKPSSKIPAVEIKMPDSSSLGAEILKWEMATAVASSIMGVNPFDEPNVTESKQNTAMLLKGPRGPRKVVVVEPMYDYSNMSIVTAEGITGLGKQKPEPDKLLSSFINGMDKGDYLSLLCYTEMSPAVEKKLAMIREYLGDKFKITTLRGYGPRYLHSIGQLYKGGPQKGHFIIFEREYEFDYEIPKMRITFERLIRAQAKGDLLALRKRKRPIITVNLKTNPATGLAQFLNLLKR